MSAAGIPGEYIVVAAIYLLLALAFSALFKFIYARTLNYPDRR